ncbi:ChaN family lipoprotein [Pseudovibrio exalbescens]|uniref:Haem-binding uptake Tiki superfamily ChaN domain-containing protein n=1 Tax=Pseudovibrio exalbescens TaxID=197461 RepID=A0A1U7JJ57_9HYPH|nr:ChaN family lipoprotein [Pseudovibrio exalbescens]OKL44735.1 hypothetical protein A3843_06545 [Pseudovibrio exalbescens]
MKRLPALMMGALLSSAVVAQAAEPGTENLLLTDHPLAETIWDVRAGEQISLDELKQRIADKDHVLLGERHDNPRHHRIQADLIASLGDSGREMFVVFEMLEPKQVNTLSDATLDTVGDLGKALDWEGRGWPDWQMYQPIAEAALTHNFKMIPGGPPYELLVRVGHGGEPSEETAQRMRWDQEYRPDQLGSLETELVDAHCGILGRESVAPLVWMQRLKDASMGLFMRIAQENDKGSVLIAGTGHTRQDRGVPYFLEDTSTVVSVAPVEVQRDVAEVTDYAMFDPALYDYVWFTGRVDEVDPCLKFKDQLDRMKGTHGSEEEAGTDG